MIEKIDDLFAQAYRELGVSSRDYDTAAHGSELHRLVTLHIAIKQIMAKGDKENEECESVEGS